MPRKKLNVQVWDVSFSELETKLLDVPRLQKELKEMGVEKFVKILSDRFVMFKMHFHTRVVWGEKIIPNRAVYLYFVLTKYKGKETVQPFVVDVLDGELETLFKNAWYTFEFELKVVNNRYTLYIDRLEFLDIELAGYTVR